MCGVTTYPLSIIYRKTYGYFDLEMMKRHECKYPVLNESRNISKSIVYPYFCTQQHWNYDFPSLGPHRGESPSSLCTTLPEIQWAYSIPGPGGGGHMMHLLLFSSWLHSVAF